MEKFLRLIISLLFICQLHLLFADTIKIPTITDTLYIGQLIPIEIDLSQRQPEQLYVQRDVQKKQLEIFDLLDLKDKPYQYLLRVAPFDTGYIYTEPIPLYAFKEGKLDTLFVESFGFYVKSSLTLADSLLKDIAPLVPFNLGAPDIIIPILALLFIGAAIYFITKLLKKKELEKIYVDTRPAWMKAMELLNAFKQKQLLEEGQYLEYYFELSLILRFFIEEQHKVNAVEMTTYEIKQALAELPEKSEIIKILSDMDKVKFAKIVPSTNEAEEVLCWIEKYIMSFVEALPQEAPNPEHPTPNPEYRNSEDADV